jgi:hypothetical protein
MLTLLFALALSATKADLDPPFIADENGKIGLWELGGSAIRQDDTLMIVPPIQFKRGAIWSNVALPTGRWSVDFDVRATKGTNGGTFAFWFVDRYGADGDIGGGPSTFRGLAIVVCIRRTTTGGNTNLGFHLFQHPLIESITRQNLFNPGIGAPFHKKHPIKVRVAFTEHKLRISCVSGAEQETTQIFDGDLVADLESTFIGFAAQSDMFTSRFDITGIHFDAGGQTLDTPRNVVFDELPRSNYLPENPAILRNPYFDNTVKLLEKQQTAAAAGAGRFTEELVSRSDILDVVEELTYASMDVASFKELNDFVSESMIPYTQKWHRRTLKVVGYVKEARNVYGVAWNYTQEMMAALNASVLQSSDKTSFKLANLAQLFESESQRHVEKIGQLKRDSNKDLKLFIGLSAIEIAVVVIFALLVQSQKIREKLFRP